MSKSHGIKSSSIDHLAINPSLISKLKKANLLSCKSILNFSVPELQRIVKISDVEAHIICQNASAAEMKSSHLDAFTMLNSSSLSKEQLSFEFFSNCKNFDGIYTGSITEICGESGSGKTQLCLLLSMCALMPQHFRGLASKVIYLHSEGEFPIKRFVELSKSFKQRNPACKELNLTDNLILKKVHNLKETMHVLQNGVPELLQKTPYPKVIIIDSVAALLRSEYDSLNLRNLMIKQLATELWKLAHTYKMAVICVNQVSGNVQKTIDSSTTVSSDIPSLGLLWSNILTTRLKIYRKLSQDEAVRRGFEVVYSAYHPRLVIDFFITGKGIEAVSECML